MVPFRTVPHPQCPRLHIIPHPSPHLGSPAHRLPPPRTSTTSSHPPKHSPPLQPDRHLNQNVGIKVVLPRLNLNRNPRQLAPGRHEASTRSWLLLQNGSSSLTCSLTTTFFRGVDDAISLASMQSLRYPPFSLSSVCEFAEASTPSLLSMPWR